jgi:hypothetical protein
LDLLEYADYTFYIFRLDDGSLTNADAAEQRLNRWLVLTRVQRRGFAPVCPEMVVELA